MQTIAHAPEPYSESALLAAAHGALRLQERRLATHGAVPHADGGDEPWSRAAAALLTAALRAAWAEARPANAHSSVAAAIALTLPDTVRKRPPGTSPAQRAHSLC